MYVSTKIHYRMKYLQLFCFVQSGLDVGMSEARRNHHLLIQSYLKSQITCNLLMILV